MKKFCESLREHAMNIINFKKEKMKLLTKEQQDDKERSEKSENENLKDKKYCKVRDFKYCKVVIIQENIEVLHIAYVI